MTLNELIAKLQLIRDACKAGEFKCKIYVEGSTEDLGVSVGCDEIIFDMEIEDDCY